ncbi:hypothetical protein [Aquimarina aquimarini]|uniref:hypothetical protein n=1 Tax=Aquimarina aquimarini TaxID=1191734 RepID=UPI000D5603E4|nr:hypothetical protein [Aquimarina aquimarini]
MRKIVSVLSIFLCVLITSCGSDDDGHVIAPVSEVSNIGAEVVEGTMVKLYWEYPTDSPASFEVVVNDKVIASKTTERVIEFDVSEFITLSQTNGKNSKEVYAKGSNLELLIKIKTYNSEGEISEGTESKRNVFINRAPGEFAFEYIRFDANSYDYIDIKWSPAQDADADILSYDVYLNDILIREDYIIGSDDYDGFGKAYYYSDFSDLINDDIVIKVVANDRSGGVTEIKETFNFKATDIDLGVLTIPYENSIDFSMSGKEPDHRLGYLFSITESIGYSFSSVANIYFKLFDSYGNYIIGGYSNNISGINLGAGSYYLEVVNEYGYIDNGINGTFNMTMQDPTLSDINLGALSAPYNNSYNFTTTSEVDAKIAYHFSVSAQANYNFEIISEDYDDYIYLYDGAGTLLGSSDYSALTGALNAGAYYIEVAGYSNYTGSGILSFDLQ